MGRKAKSLMFLGTGSDVGKSLLTAAFCRILKNDGYRVAPFKAQNMALNSYITREGGEMGRAQVVQAEAAGIDPHVDMNPILLKPTSQMGSQVIVRGKVVGNFSAMDYYQYKRELLPVVRECYERLARDYDLVVLEGAGSAVELNLKEHDIVNLSMAEMADARCILIGDIDRGGIFAALLGSYMLLSPAEKDRLIGFLVNKLRGDPKLFAGGVDIIESHSGKPVLGVVPHLDQLALPEEDSVALGRRMRHSPHPAGGNDKLAVGVVRLPFISNYTDFDCFEQEPEVNLTYFDQTRLAFAFDAIILPGSKNTLEDLDFLRRTGLAEAIVAFYKSGGMVVGICGGYQMLGLSVKDPHGVESSLSQVPGLGLLEMETEMYLDKVTSQVEAEILRSADVFAVNPASRPESQCAAAGAGRDLTGPLHGYEIHMGRSWATGRCRPLFRITRRDGRGVDEVDGLIGLEGRVWGTYIHGIFDNDGFRRDFLRSLQARAGKSHVSLSGTFDYRLQKEQQYDLLAQHVRQHIDLARIYQAIGLA